MGEEAGLSVEAKAALSVVSEECLKRFPAAVLTAEFDRVNENSVKINMINNGKTFSGSVRVSLVRSETKEWLNQVEKESGQHN